jgi:hypothetical protein
LEYASNGRHVKAISNVGDHDSCVPECYLIYSALRLMDKGYRHEMAIILVITPAASNADDGSGLNMSVFLTCIYCR